MRRRVSAQEPARLLDVDVALTVVPRGTSISTQRVALGGWPSEKADRLGPEIAHTIVKHSDLRRPQAPSLILPIKHGLDRDTYNREPERTSGYDVAALVNGHGPQRRHRLGHVTREASGVARRGPARASMPP